MGGRAFVRIIKEAFDPFLRELSFTMEPPSISGRYYGSEFVGKAHRIVISFEPGDWVFFVYIFNREYGAWSDIDDRARTPRLSDLNLRYMSQISDEERRNNESFFESITTRDTHERKMLKFAKELRLVLPKYMLNRHHNI